MRSNRGQNWYWKIGIFCLCMMISLVHSKGQSFSEALRAGETIKVEWIQQELKESTTKDTPLFPDELNPGESEIRVGLNLKPVDDGGRLIAEFSYINYLAFPELEEQAFHKHTEGLLSEPIILDTRFQDQYFNPELFLLDLLRQLAIPISCKTEAYQAVFSQFAQEIEQSSATSSLLKEQIDWLESTSLPSALSASSMAAFFCQLLEKEVPKHENPIRIQSRQQGDIHLVDYLKVDYPRKRCLLKGKIQSPATDQVRVKFFRQGNWLEHWRDSIIQLDTEGNFQLAFSLDHPETISVFHGYQSMHFYFEPGDSLQFLTNANAFYREMQVQGNAQAENEFLLDFYHQMRGDTLYGRYDYDLLEKNHLTYFQKVQAKEDRELDFLFQRAPMLRPSFTTFMDRRLKLEHANTQWEAGYRFMTGKRIVLEPEVLRLLQKKANLLYRLPPQKNFDFNVEEFLSFQYYLLQNDYQSSHFNRSKDFILAQLLPSKETFVRHALMQLFRSYSDLGQLTESGQW